MPHNEIDIAVHIDQTYTTPQKRKVCICNNSNVYGCDTACEPCEVGEKCQKKIS